MKHLLLLTSTAGRLLMLALAFALAAPSALADGTETLGPPSITIEPGNKFLFAGTGLVTQPGTITFDLPDGAIVRQVLLYWEGQHTTPDGDNTIVVDGQGVTGQLIGGPEYFFTDFMGPTNSSAFRADISGLGLVSPGLNTLTVSGLTNDFANDGAGVIVIYDDGTSSNDIQIVDGLDLAFIHFPGDLQSTVAQTFTFVPSSEERIATLGMFVASVADDRSNPEPTRPSVIEVTVDGVTTSYNNLLASHQGLYWDTVELPVTIPAGVTTVTVQVLSKDNLNSGFLPASLTWIAAGFSLAPPPPPAVGSLGDFVWHDLDSDGIQEPGEPGINGVLVNLKDCSSNVLGTTTTQGGGIYLFEQLPAGCYVVDIDPSNFNPGGVLAGFVPSPTEQGGDPSVDSNPDPFSKNLAAGEHDRTIDFGYYMPQQEFGCSLTPGYWKNHPEAWPAGSSTSNPFFTSGQSWLDALTTPPKKGNAYYILAHAYIAAALNGLNGANTSSISTTLAHAEDLLSAGSPGNPPSGSLREDFIATAATLDAYNNGEIGPGHCDAIQQTTSGSQSISSTAPGESPVRFSLDGAYPNPFNPATNISFTMPEAGHVTIAVYDMLGRQVNLLANGTFEAGSHRVVFDAANLPSGTYLFRVESTFGAATGRVTLLK